MSPEIKATIQGTLGFIAFGGMVFWGAGTLDYWQGWAFLAVCAAGNALAASVLLRDRELLQRRMNLREREAGHVFVQILVMAGVFASIAISLIAYRRALLVTPAALNVLGDAIVAAAFITFFVVLRLNRFAAATIQVAEDQRVISTGIYAHVRHPWYVGLLLFFTGVPLALGSLCGLVVLLPILATLVWRLVSEERFLVDNLVGYSAYLEKVRWRLLPFVF